MVYPIYYSIVKKKVKNIHYTNNYIFYCIELLTLTSKYRLVNIAYEHIKQNIYTQNLFPVVLANLKNLDILFAKFWENPIINNTIMWILSCCSFDVYNSGIALSKNGTTID